MKLFFLVGLLSGWIAGRLARRFESRLGVWTDTVGVVIALLPPVIVWIWVNR